MEDQRKSDIFSFELDEYGRSNLLEMTRWTKFLAIVGFILMGIMLMAAIFSSMALSSLSSNPLFAGLGGTALILFYVIILSLYFYPVYSLWKYSTLMKVALHTSDKKKFNDAIVYLKNMFKYFGIVTLVVLGLNGLGLILGIVAAMLR